jgi:head-tail adaptor
MQKRYDRIVTVQRKSITQSGSGEEVVTWADIAFQIPAGHIPTPGSERMTNAQEVAEQEVTFTVRFHAIPDAYRPLTPEDRIIYPAHDVSANAQAPGIGRIFDVIGSEEVGREHDLRIRTKRRTDAG